MESPIFGSQLRLLFVELPDSQHSQGAAWRDRPRLIEWQKQVLYLHVVGPTPESRELNDHRRRRHRRQTLRGCSRSTRVPLAQTTETTLDVQRLFLDPTSAMLSLA